MSLFRAQGLLLGVEMQPARHFFLDAEEIPSDEGGEENAAQDAWEARADTSDLGRKHSVVSCN